MPNFLPKLLFALVFGLAITAWAGVPSAHAQGSGTGADIVVDEGARTSVAGELLERVGTSWPWYVARASGIVAAVVFVILALSGIGFITGTTYAFLEPIVAWATHRALGIVLAVAVLLHVGALYFDSFVAFNIGDLLIPFASTYRPVELFGYSIGSLYVALGIFSLYALALNILFSLLWIEKKPKIWKAIHVTSYLVMALVFVHALFLGTDLAHGLLRYVWIGLGVSLFVAALFRLWRVKTV